MAKAGSRIHRLPLIPHLRILGTDSAILGKKKSKGIYKKAQLERAINAHNRMFKYNRERERVADSESRTDSSENRTCPGRR